LSGKKYDNALVQKAAIPMTVVSAALIALVYVTDVLAI
jgi:hypothetical protein